MTLDRRLGFFGDRERPLGIGLDVVSQVRSSQRRSIKKTTPASWAPGSLASPGMSPGQRVDCGCLVKREEGVGRWVEAMSIPGMASGDPAADGVASCAEAGWNRSCRDKRTCRDRGAGSLKKCAAVEPLLGNTFGRALVPESLMERHLLY